MLFPWLPCLIRILLQIVTVLLLHSTSWFVALISYSPNTETPKESSSFDDYQMSVSLFQFHSWLRGERDPPSYFGDLEIEAQEETLSEVPWLVGWLDGFSKWCWLFSPEIGSSLLHTSCVTLTLALEIAVFQIDCRPGKSRTE